MQESRTCYIWHSQRRGAQRSFQKHCQSSLSVLPASSRHGLYAAEFRTRQKKNTESWADIGDNLGVLASRAFLDLGKYDKQQIALLQFLAIGRTPKWHLGYARGNPKLLEAVTGNLELESYPTLSCGPGRVPQLGGKSLTPRRLLSQL